MIKKIILLSALILAGLNISAQKTSFDNLKIAPITSFNKAEVSTISDIVIPEDVSKHWSMLSFFINEETKDIIITSIHRNGKVSNKTFKLEDIINPFNTQFHAEFIDVVSERKGKELIITWNSMDMRNGIEDGYEDDRSGILIITLDEKLEIIADIPTRRYYMYYSSDASSSNENYHAKSDDGTQTEGYEQSMDVEIIERSIKISNVISTRSNTNYELQPTYKAGVYQYSALTNRFELK